MTIPHTLRHTHKRIANSYEIYELWNGDEKVITLSYNTAMNTARLETRGSKRLFIIDHEGLRKSRTVFTNEYGVKIGEIISEKLHANEGFLEIDGERFYYSLRLHNTQELLIYKTSKLEPLLCCRFPAEETTDPFYKKSEQTLDDKFSCILMALCWPFCTETVQINAMAYA